jgi:hypothetical protein
MPKLFRAMIADETQMPAEGTGSRFLGVRTTGEYADIQPDENGLVHPGQAGMSVTPENPAKLPVDRLPKAKGGKGKDPVFEISDTDLPAGLTYVPDHSDETGAHGYIVPRCPMPIQEYMSLIQSTKTSWRRLP